MLQKIVILSYDNLIFSKSQMKLWELILRYILLRNHDCVKIIIDGMAIIMNGKQESSHVELRDGNIVKYIIAIEAKKISTFPFYFLLHFNFLSWRTFPELLLKQNQSIARIDQSKVTFSSANNDIFQKLLFP